MRARAAVLIILVIGSATHATLPIMRRSSTPKRGKTTSDNRKQTAPPLAAAELGCVTAGYQLWLVRQPLSPNTRRTYLGRARQYCAYLRASGNDYGNPLSDPHARDYAIRDFKSHLKKSCKAKPASVNLTLAALDNLYLFLGLGRPNVRREDLPKEAPRALEPENRSGSCGRWSDARPSVTGQLRCCCFIRLSALVSALAWIQTISRFPRDRERSLSALARVTSTGRWSSTPRREKDYRLGFWSVGNDFRTIVRPLCSLTRMASGCRSAQSISRCAAWAKRQTLQSPHTDFGTPV